MALPHLIRQLGADPAVLIRGSGLEDAALAHPENRVPYAALAALLNNAANRTGCEHFGLLAG